MSQECARCGAAIEPDAVRYERHRDDADPGRDAVASYCSVNCLADGDHVAEATARTNLFEDAHERFSR